MGGSDGSAAGIEKAVEDYRDRPGELRNKVGPAAAGVQGFREVDIVFGRLIVNLPSDHFGDCFPNLAHLITSLAALIQVLLDCCTLGGGEQPPDKIKTSLIAEMLHLDLSVFTYKLVYRPTNRSERNLEKYIL